MVDYKTFILRWHVKMIVDQYLSLKSLLNLTLKLDSNSNLSMEEQSAMGIFNLYLY